MKLTKRERLVFELYKHELNERGILPTHNEVADKMGYSYFNARQISNSLVRKGYVRNIRLVRLGELNEGGDKI